MKTFLVFFIVVFIIIGFANAQSPTTILVDFNKAKLVWNWDKGVGGDVESFKVKCGISSGNYNIISSVDCPECREILVSNVINSPGEYFCVVTAFNRFGESIPSNEVHFEAGLSPVSPSNLRLVIP